MTLQFQSLSSVSVPARASGRDSATQCVHGSRVSPITIAALREQAGEKPVLAAVHAQLQSRATRSTKAGKPYLELAFADSTGHFALKIWSDSPIYQQADALPAGQVFRLEGKWTQNSYGIEGRDVEFHQPGEQALTDFFAGNPVIREKQDRDFAEIRRLCESIADPRLHALCARFFAEHGSLFRRTAAAKKNHHARRGGLVEHVAQMMRAAAALCPVYPQLNRDLLLAGVLLHDCGKLWENTYPEHGFTQKLDLFGELMSHIPIGIEIVNKLWHAEITPNAEWGALSPTNDHTRFHLLHLIASHHGELQFGSPVLPRTPEAFALHYIDNLDAKLEMLGEAYTKSQELAPGIYERVFPLSTNLVMPLPTYVAPMVNPVGGNQPDDSSAA
jgi:3'-5' exoribonuclease